MIADWVPEGRLEADGKMLEYRCFGPSPDQAPTIVLLHEGLGCAALWRDFPQKLSEATGYGVMAWSRAGYGQSDPVELPRPVDYMTQEAIHVVKPVLDAIGFRQGFLLGHSDGATISAEYAGRVGDVRLTGIILMAPHFFTEPMGLAEIRKAHEAYETTDLRSRMAKYHRDPDNAFHGWNDGWLNPEFETWNVADVIDRWTIPCLAIQGRGDQYGTLEQVYEIERRAPDLTEILILDDCRHSPQFDQPDAVINAVAKFCREHSAVETGS